MGEKLDHDEDKLQNENTPEQKQENWDKIFDGLKYVGDKLGYRMDEGIKEAVTSFIVHDFPTRASCEGHLRERFGKVKKISPYIIIGQAGPEERFVGNKNIKAKIAAECGVSVEEIEEHKEAANKYWDYIEKNSIPETQEFVIMREKNGELRQKAESLLTQFYEDKEAVDRPVKILKVGIFGSFYVTTAKNLQDIGRKIDNEQMNVASQELAQEQEEFGKFTAFLKEKYFNEQ